MNVKPEGWYILKFYREDGTESFKIFSTWQQDDTWRLSSGSDTLSNLTVQGKCLIWPQMSGSIYELPFEGQNQTTSYTLSILEQKIIPTLTEGRIKLTRLDLINNDSFDINTVTETKLNNVKDFNPQKCVNNTQRQQNDVHTKVSREDSYTELSNEFDELFKRIESPKDPLAIFEATEEELRATYRAGKTERD
ncbi:hypothetical protein BB427_01475 [Pseudoalteromonas sp. BMB]|uniref:hypothetical protein n=1 Tax=Pseudoalteromonas sp. BMB TaxID=1874619 RepID=UPI00083E183A|nr:hypothetical protein [Pseudoalteromonas sp. BMB]ODB39794.1 hypothetical protein BB427_01475 [Pseudoalteromonas sp. BMB]